MVITNSILRAAFMTMKQSESTSNDPSNNELTGGGGAAPSFKRPSSLVFQHTLGMSNWLTKWPT